MAKPRAPWVRAAVSFIGFVAGWALLLLAGHLWQHPRAELPQTPELALWPRLGVNLAPAALDNLALLQALAQADVRWVRVEVPWSEVEPEPGVYRWEPWDARWRRLQAFGITPVVVLNTSPRWARAPEDRDNPLAPPQDPKDLARFAGRFAARYRDLLRYYQVWHEPNIAPHWGAREADPLGYVRLLQLTSTAIREADPDAVILSAALAPTLDPGRVNYNDLRYLEALYRLGAGAWFDVLAWQGYGFDRPPDDPPAENRLNFRRWELARAMMRRYGDATKPIWLTAFGWNAPPPGQKSPWEEVTPEDQARYLARAVAYVRRAAPDVGPMFWAHAYPSAPPAGLEWGFALWHPDGTPKHIWRTFAALAKAPGVPVGRHPFPLPCAVSPSPCREVARPERRPFLLDENRGALRISFDGTGIWLEAIGGPHWQTVWVEVDGRPPAELPKDAQGRAYLNLYRPTATPLLVPIARDLPYGRHVLTLRPALGDPVWPLTAVIVTGQATHRPWPALLLLFAAGALLLILSWRGLPRQAAIRVPAFPLAAQGLVLVAAVIPFTTRWVVIGPYTYVLPEVALLVTVAATGYQALRSRGRRPMETVSLPGQTHLLLAGLVIAALLVSTGVSEHPQENLTAIKARVLFPALLYILVRRSPSDLRRRMAAALVFGAAGLAAWALVELPFRPDLWTDGVPRARAFFGSPNHLALVLVRVLPFALVLTLRSRRPFYPLATALIIGGLVATFSRAAWLLGVPLVLWMLGQARLLGKWGKVLGAGVPVIVGGLLAMRDTATWAQRLFIWEGTLRLVRDHIWVGIGLNGFPWTYPQYAVPTAWREPLLYHAHNVVLTTAATLGVPATAALAAWIGRRLSTRASGDLAVAARASLAAGIACGLVDALWALDDLAYLTSWALALCDPPQRLKEGAEPAT